MNFKVIITSTLCCVTHSSFASTVTHHPHIYDSSFRPQPNNLPINPTNALLTKVQGMLNLQKLQSLSASIQQHSANMPSLASLQGLAGLSAAAAAAAAGLNSPLNLSVGSASTLQAALGGVIGCPSSSGGGGGSGGGASSGAGAVQMPQLILASGQLIQGVQGAQLLIPTAQGTF